MGTSWYLQSIIPQDRPQAKCQFAAAGWATGHGRWTKDGGDSARDTESHRERQDKPGYGHNRQDSARLGNGPGRQRMKVPVFLAVPARFAARQFVSRTRAQSTIINPCPLFVLCALRAFLTAGLSAVVPHSGTKEEVPHSGTKEVAVRTPFANDLPSCGGPCRFRASWCARRRACAVRRACRRASCRLRRPFPL